MDKTTAHILCDINTAFYRENAASFSVTRTAPWHGWKECARFFDEHGIIVANNSSKISVFDLACGNLRFEEYLCEQFPQTNFSFFAVDNCEPLLPKSAQTTDDDGFSSSLHYPHCSLWFQNLDVVSALLNEAMPLDSCFEQSLCKSLCDISVSFGFMHHIPTQALRLKALQILISKTRSKGLLAVSFWQFLNNATLAKKAYQTHEQALDFFASSSLQKFDPSQLEPGDFFLGWNDKPNQYRYCHNFSKREIDELACGVAQEAAILSCFIADGRTNNLNSYLILQKR